MFKNGNIREVIWSTGMINIGERDFDDFAEVISLFGKLEYILLAFYMGCFDHPNKEENRYARIHTGKCLSVHYG